MNTANEIETRARIVSPDPIEQQLAKLGFQFKKEWEQLDVMFDQPDAGLFRSGRKIRIRIEPGQMELTYKGLSMGDKSTSRRQEINVTIQKEELKQYMDLLQALGYPECFRIPKKRKLYQQGQISVMLDCWPIIGWIVEVEGIEEEVHKTAKAIAPDSIFSNLRLKDMLYECSIASNKSVRQLIDQYRTETGVDLGHLELILEE